MASVVVAPAAKKPMTLKEKIEVAHDKITSIFGGIFGTGTSSLKEFMIEYTKIERMATVSLLDECIHNLFDVYGTTPRTITAGNIREKLMEQLTEIKNQQRTEVASYVLHKNGQQNFTPKRLICLFVCGLISFKYMTPFESWMKFTKDNEIEYVRDFLSIIVEPPEIVVYSNEANFVPTIETEENRKIPDKLFLTSSIPGNARNVVILDTFPGRDPWTNLSESITNESTITSDPVLWYAYIIQDKQEIMAFVDSTQSSTKCIGIEDKKKDRKYIFAYGFPTYDRVKSPKDQVSLWGPYIDKPYEAYANILQSFKLTLTDDTAFISKYTY